MAFSPLIFTKLTNAEQHYVQIPYTELHQNWTINVESADIYSLTPHKVWFPLC
jgi:hypothetical protein